jgi:hypothetical protein
MSHFPSRTLHSASMKPGLPALLRFVRCGKVRRAVPHIRVEDSPELVALYLPVGTRTKIAVADGRPIRGQADRDWELQDHDWHTYSALKLIQWGIGHSLELLWHADGDAFAGWYVNLQEPLRRSPLGFDTDDLALDIRVDPDGNWRWKDEDELEALVAAGRFTGAEAAEIRAEGERVVAAHPWPTGWEEWRPDPTWPSPELPKGWDVV